MATLTGTKIANTYKQLLQVGSSNTGLTGTVQAVQDGQGNNSPLQLSQNAVNINGTFQLSGVTLTANASTLNAVADLTGATGIVAVSAGNVYGRTITGGTGVSVTNGDGTEGNPTIALNTTGVTSASYGPATNIEVNAVGQIVSAGAATSVNVSGVTANTFTGGTFAGTTGDFSSNVSVGGNLVITGEFSPASLSVTGTINANKISATDATFNNVVSAGFFVGDGSGLVNVPSAEGGTMKFITAGTGINFTVDGVTSATIPVSGTLNINTNQSFGIVSATNIDADELLIAGVSAATVTEVAAVSALTSVNLAAITSINTVTDTINSNVSTVSIQTSVNAAAITSINTILGDGSNFATSAELAATSLALATSIDNSNTNITTNTNAITSINTVVANVSALTSVNAAAITSINTILESDVSADSGTFNTLTVVTSASVGGTFNVGGNVGIGTASPSQKLTIQGTDARIYLTGANTDINMTGTADGQLSLDGNGYGFGIALNSSGANLYTNTASRDLIFGTDETERMRIDGSGNLLIGTTSATTDLAYAPKLKLSGNGPALYFEETDTSQDYSITALGGKFYIRDATAVQNRLTIDSSGNVGIGTTSPSALLDVLSSGTGAETIAEFGNATIAGGLSIETNGNLDWGFNALNSRNLTFSTNQTERMRIDSSGNVGIGVSTIDTALSTKLHVAGTIRTDTGAAAANPAIVFDHDNFADADANYIMLDRASEAMRFNVNASERMRIDSSGNVGIGTSSPNELLTVQRNGTAVAGLSPSTVASFQSTSAITQSSYLSIIAGSSGSTAQAAIFFGDADDPDIGKVLYRNADDSMDFVVNASSRMKILSSGNVGIGTSSPSKQLHITKSAVADIKVIADGAIITLDLNAAQNFKVTLGGNRTFNNPANVVPGQTGSIFVVQDGTGSRTLSFNSYWKFAGGTAPTLSTAAGSVDRIDYIVYTTTAIHAVATLNVS